MASSTPTSPSPPPSSTGTSTPPSPPSPASEATTPAPSLASAIRYNDRVFLTGTTGSGKSTLARRLFLSAAAPRLVLDPADSTLTEVPGAVTFHDARRPTNPAGESWRDAATARFVPLDPDDADAYGAVYDWAFRNGPRYVWCDEAGMVLPSTGSPPGARRVLTQGRKRAIGHMACHTRPRWVDRDLVAQAQHVFVFSTPSVQDRKSLAENMGVPLDVLEAQHAQLPEFGFMWWDQRARRLTVCDPLKE